MTLKFSIIRYNQKSANMHGKGDMKKSNKIFQRILWMVPELSNQT